jgi:predicted NUDIX family NTP pyrophosphohydrolase
MSPRLSAALLLHRGSPGSIEVMLVHMGGPFWSHKDAGAWSIPKGEHGEPEDSLTAARREFAEETGLAVPDGEPVDLGVIKQGSGKLIRTWAVEADLDVTEIRSNSFELEWPRGSGTIQRFPEVDAAGWFDLPSARHKLVKGQVPFLDALAERLRAPSGEEQPHSRGAGTDQP